MYIHVYVYTYIHICVFIGLVRFGIWLGLSFSHSSLYAMYPCNCLFSAFAFVAVDAWCGFRQVGRVTRANHYNNATVMLSPETETALTKSENLLISSG